MKSTITDNDSTVMVAVGIGDSVEDLARMFYSAVIGVGYAPSTVAAAMYEVGDELMSSLDPEWNV